MVKEACVNKKVGEFKMRKIEFVRRDLGMSQRDFGAYVGVDASYICNAEKNGVMYQKHRERIAEKLGLDDGGSTLLEPVKEVEVVM